jgi:3-oxoadipate enol-lactonase
LPTATEIKPIAKGINVRDTVLWVDDTGEPDLPVALALHSLFLDNRMFDGFVAQAAGRYRVVRPEYRGQGRSAPATTDIVDMDQAADDMAALIETLELRDVNILMQSMGGDVGFRLIHRMPERFRAAAVMGSSACNEPPEQLERFRKWVDDACTGGFQGETLEMTTQIMFGETTRADPAKQDVVNLWRERMSRLPLSLRPAMSGVIERGNALPLLPELTLPALVFSGVEDVPRPPAWAKEMADALPNSKLVTLHGIGHSPILEAPETVIPQILEFFDNPRID